jgi:hypothetical protein
MLTLRLIATGLTGASAFMVAERQQSDSSEDAYENICQPTNATGFPDFSAPCNLWSRTQRLCVYGEQIRGIVDGPGLNNYGDEDGKAMKQHSPGYQRDCVCQSQLFDQMNGCMACNDALGGDSRSLIASSAIESFSSEYCAVSATPTRGYIAAINSVLAEVAEQTDLPTSSSSPINSLGDKTDVSLYWTPSATGASAWDVGLPTGISATFSSLHTSGGQIIPTAAARGADSGTGSKISTNDAAQTNSGDKSAESTSTVSEGRAVQTGMAAPCMIVGFMGAAAIAAAL